MFFTISFSGNASIGSVTIDGKIYNQIAFRPDYKFGKFGLGLDWNSFWWDYYEEIPTWGQHALCFIRCKFHGLSIPL